MKKHISFLLILSIIFVLLSGCEHEYNTIPAPIAYVPSTNNSTSIDTTKVDLAEDLFNNSTVSAPETPYFKSNNIQYATSLNFTLPFAVYCSNDVFSKIIDVPGVSLEADTMYYEITSVSASKPDENDYIDVTISVNASYSFLVHEDDSVYDNSFYSYSIHRAEFELADYYTGIHFPNRTYDNASRDTLLPNIEINGNIYAISENASSEWSYESHNWKILDHELPLYELPVSGTITNTYTIHMPKDYDGLVMYINKNGMTKFTQADLDAFKGMTINEKDITYVLDDCNAKDIIAIRISPLIK